MQKNSIQYINANPDTNETEEVEHTAYELLVSKSLQPFISSYALC